MLLNLSKEENWKKATRSAIKKIIPPQIIHRAQQEDHNTMYSDNLNYIIKHYINSDPSISDEKLLRKFDKNICHHYKIIKGFHACRITNEESYIKHGLRPKSKKLILELALERLGDFASHEKIKAACDELEIDKNYSGVYFFVSLSSALKTSQNHYLKNGSETLQRLLFSLGLDNRGILSSQGQSCIIECDLPIKYIKYEYRISVWRQMITTIFKEKAGAAAVLDEDNLCYVIIRKVEPECIKKFHYIEDSFYTCDLTPWH